MDFVTEPRKNSLIPVTPNAPMTKRSALNFSASDKITSPGFSEDSIATTFGSKPYFFTNSAASLAFESELAFLSETDKTQIEDFLAIPKDRKS